MWHVWGPDHVLSVHAADEPGARHAHHAVQVVFALDEPVRADLDDGAVRGGVIVLGPDVHHQVSGRCAQVLLEPEYGTGRHLLGLLDGAPAWSTGQAPLQGAQLTEPATEQDAGRVRARVFDALGLLLADVAPLPPLDPRVLAVLDELLDETGATRSLADLAAMVSLSPSRLSHLFVQQTGLPIRRYAAWRRSILALLRMAEGHSLGQAAHGTGFADQAALSRLHRAQYGRPPSRLDAELRRPAPPQNPGRPTDSRNRPAG